MEQFTNLNQELETQKALCSEKDSKIISINSEREKLQGDLNLHKRMCKCGFNTSLKERVRIFDQSCHESIEFQYHSFIFSRRHRYHIHCRSRLYKRR